MDKETSQVLVDTAGIDGIGMPISYARNKQGKINLDAYKGKKGQITENNLKINVKIINSRVRYGHLDLCVTPLAGEGQTWVERKNISIHNDPAFKKTSAKPVQKNQAENTKIAKKGKTANYKMSDIKKLLEAMNQAKSKTAADTSWAQYIPEIKINEL